MIGLTLVAVATIAETAEKQPVVINRTEQSAVMDERARQLDSFASCIVKADRQKVTRVVSMPDFGAEQYAGLKSVVQKNNECLATTGYYKGTFPPALLLGALAKTLYLEKYKAGPPDFGPLANPAEPSPADSGQRQISGDVAMASFSQCVVAAEPLASDSIVRSKPGSPEEMEALGKLKTRFPSCLTVASSMALTRSSLRLGLAAALFRQAQLRDMQTVTADKQPQRPN